VPLTATRGVHCGRPSWLFSLPLQLPQNPRLSPQRLDGVFAIKRPDLDPARRLLYATICAQTAEGLMPLLADAQGERRVQVIDEMKAMLTAYMRTVFG
jgi:hypothetical protein